MSNASGTSSPQTIITLEKATPEHVRATYADDGDYLVLTIGDDRWTLPADELPGGLHQAHELQRRRIAALESHEAWCDRAVHAEIASTDLSPHPTCVGREHRFTLGGQECAGYWQQAPEDDRPTLLTDWPGGHRAGLSPSDARAWLDVLSHVTPTPELEQVREMFTEALAELGK